MINNNEFLWVEKYRPENIKDCILSKNIKDTFIEYIFKKEIPNLLLCGKCGIGKTTSALVLCKSIGCDYLFINASNENGIDTLRTKITNYATSVSLSGGRKVIILDEFDATTYAFQTAFRNFLESYSSNCTFILTANYKNKIIEPIHSRCANIDFNISKDEYNNLLKKFFIRILTILDNENVEYDKKVIGSFVKKYFPDNRRILNELQRYSISGKIDIGLLTQFGDLQLKELIGYLKNKNFLEVRNWVNQNNDIDYNLIYRKIYDCVYEFISPSSIPQTILTLSKYQYQSSFVVDQEIQLLAFFVELMADVVWL